MAPPRPVTTSTHLYRDAKGQQYTYQTDVLHATQPSANSPAQPPVILAHPPGILGISRNYWDHVLVTLSLNERLLSRHAIARFDWLGTGGTTPKPSHESTTFSASALARQLAHVANAFGERVVIVAAEEAEPVVLRFAIDFPNMCRALVLVTGVESAVLAGARANMWSAFLRGRTAYWVWNWISSKRNVVALAHARLSPQSHFKEAWVSRVLNGCKDSRGRFAVFSYLAGLHFAHRTDELAHVLAPALCIAAVRSGKGGDGINVASLHDLSPRESTSPVVKSLRHRCEALPNCRGVVVQGFAGDLFFEMPLLTLQQVELLLQAFY